MANAGIGNDPRSTTRNLVRCKSCVAKEVTRIDGEMHVGAAARQRKRRAKPLRSASPQPQADSPLGEGSFSMQRRMADEKIRNDPRSTRRNLGGSRCSAESRYSWVSSCGFIAGKVVG